MAVRFVHGGDVYAHPGVLDFSASLSPLGIPAPARRALVEHVDDCARYPDPESRELRAALAAFEHVDESWVLPTAGASDALSRICRALRPRCALVCQPCYAGYEQALRPLGTVLVGHRLRAEEGFRPGQVLVDALDGSIDLVFVANPNNPTGARLDPGLLEALLTRARQTGARVVLDECFVDLSARVGSTPLVGAHPELVIVKALTKTYALAGLRVGYALTSDRELFERLDEEGDPWAVSVPAQLAGVASLADTGYLARTRTLVAQERARLSRELAVLGLRVVPSEANYLLFRHAGRTRSGDPLDQALLRKGILIRSCASFEGLDASWHRVAVRTPEEDGRLLEALREVLS